MVVLQLGKKGVVGKRSWRKETVDWALLAGKLPER